MNLKKLALWGSIIAMALALALAGCGKAEEESGTAGGTGTTAGAADTNTTADNSAAGSGATMAADFKNDKGELVCPVMGTVIANPSAASGSEVYEGKTYHFCCGLCPPMFKADPKKYANGANLANATPMDMGSGDEGADDAGAETS
jgi:YHS domain-containing protein